MGMKQEAPVTLTLTHHSRIVGSQYGTSFMLPF